MVGSQRRQFVLFGSSIVQLSFCNGGWGAILSYLYAFKPYLPSETPNGLKRPREKELEEQRGNGQGERKIFKRIYDYDTYNDLKDLDQSNDLARPVIGSEDHPYPWRVEQGALDLQKNVDASAAKELMAYLVKMQSSLSEVSKYAPLANFRITSHLKICDNVSFSFIQFIFACIQMYALLYKVFS